MTMGYNLGQLAVGLHEKTYDYHSGIIDDRMEKIDRLTENLSHFTDLLTVINTELQKSKTHLDLSAHGDLVDRVREICPDLLPTGVYTWDGEDPINLLKDNIVHQSKKTGSIINPEMMLNTQGMQNIVELTSVFTQIIKTEREQGQRFVSNQRPH